MPLKINAKTVRDTLEEHLSGDAEIIKAAGELFVFYAAASSGEPLVLAAGIGLILNASAAAIKGASRLIARLFNSQVQSKTSLAPYDQFRIIFYASCLQAYFEALQKPLTEFRKGHAIETVPRGELKGTELTTALKEAQARAEEGEIPFLLGIDPLKGEVPLYKALSEWIVLLMKSYGYPEYTTQPVFPQVVDNAKQRFHVFLASDTVEAIWIRNYLLIESQSQTATIANDLASVRSALETWLPIAVTPKAKRVEAWQDYRRQLAMLPDQKDSMYNEEFGVREVFIRPDGNYAIAGTSSESGRPQRVSDLGSVIGGLLSTRVAEGDLIILCGGPGSGKSTLCRVLASELASDASVYPVFVRLRRLKEGSDIPAFLEGHLSGLGLIDRISDLRNLKNVVIILDGFDELVMASRARLRQFFNALREDYTNGPLRGVRIIVSGRDTLFPGGEGLPIGSHVLTLLPFDRPKVAAWSAKWRSRHKVGGGATFRPEALIDEQEGKQSALHHLVTWPLTLHLVARVHTCGTLLVADKASGTLTKAILYRSILAETATRQREQTDGSGRLEPRQMRELLRAIAWRMYKDGRDSMDPNEVLPILDSFFPGRSEAELGELSEVAVVNSPEITKGEQTGFEFVHKSFAEYLTAEHIAIKIARITFQAPEFDSEQLTWRMTDAEAASEVAKFTAIRLLSPEVQEMLEPMLGDFEGFLHTTARPSQREEGLNRIVSRFEGLLDNLLRGKLTRAIEERSARAAQISNLLEGFANFAAAVVLIGAAAARQIQEKTGSANRKFSLEPFEGAFWRLLCLMHAGGLYVDQQLASRLGSGCTVSRKERKTIADMDTPIKTAWLVGIEGFQSVLGKAVEQEQTLLLEMTLALRITLTLLAETLGKRRQMKDDAPDLMRLPHYGFDFRNEGFISDALVRAALVQTDRNSNREEMEHVAYNLLRLDSKRQPRHMIEELFDRTRATWPGHGPGPLRVILDILVEIAHRSGEESSDWIHRLLSTLRLR